MATSIKISGLPTLTVPPTGDDLLLIVDNPVSNPVTKQINVSTFFSNVTIGKIIANGSVGTANQVLLSNGTGTFWSSDLNLATANVGAGAFYSNTSGIYVTNASATNIVVSASANIGGYFTVNSSSASKTVNSSFSGANLNIATTNTYITSNTTITGTTTTVTSNASFTGANVFLQNKIQIGSAAGYDHGSLAVIEIDASQNTYVQSVIQNANSQLNASSDLVLTNDQGNDTVNYVDLGINSSTYSNTTYAITGAGDAYLYASNGQLVVGTATVKDVVIHAGGTAATNRVLTVNTSVVTVNNIPLNVGTGSINAASYTVGATFTANATLVNAAAINITGQVNTVNFFASTSANVGANNQLTTTALVLTGNSTTAPTLTIASNSTAGVVYGNSTITGAVSANLQSNTGSVSILLANGTGGATNTTITAAGLNTTGSVNAASHTVGAIAAANGALLNATSFGFGNSTANVTSTPTILTVGNSTVGIVNTFNVKVSSNNINVGTFTAAANGFTFLTNGIKMNWGWVSANSTVGAVTFTSAFTTCYVVTATSNNAVTTYQPSVTTFSASAATILTANITATNVFWQAIGI